LNPFFLSVGTEAYRKNQSVMHPQADYTILTPNSWDYTLGDDDILVAPIVDNSSDHRTVQFPKGNDWIDWWTNETYLGGTSHDFILTLDKFPVFKRKGSILPLNIDRRFLGGHGDSYFTNALTILIEHPIEGHHERNVYEWKGSGVSIAYTLSSNRNGKVLELFASEYHRKRLMFLVSIDPTSSDLISVSDQISSDPLKEVGHDEECSYRLRRNVRGWCLTSYPRRALIISPGNVNSKEGTRLLIKW